MALVVSSLLAAPSVTADPARFPDMNRFTEVDPAPYNTYGTYPTTTGVQFTTPGGYRCRMTFTGKANAWSADCWGALPGTTFNHVMVTTWYQSPPAEFSNVDLADMETYTEMGREHTEKKSIDPASYKPLPAGSKIVWEKALTCVVEQDVTACRLGNDADSHGFVLSPQGSEAF